MSDWLHNLPVPLMAVVIFGFTYLLAGAIYALVVGLTTEERAKAFRAISPAIPSMLSIIFGLFVAFTAAQVWNDSDRASAAVSREASALRTAVLLAAALPAEQETRLRGLLLQHAQHAAAVEWPMMAHQAAAVRAAPSTLAEALQFVVSISPQGANQQIALQEIVNELRTALDARRQRIIISHSEVNPVKWWCLYLQAACALLVIGLVHCDNRQAARIAIGLFATGVAASVLLIAAHDRPFTGQISVSPEPLLQFMPERPTAK